jgi:hypothetical protein
MTFIPIKVIFFSRFLLSHIAYLMPAFGICLALASASSLVDAKPKDTSQKKESIDQKSHPSKKSDVKAAPMPKEATSIVVESTSDNDAENAAEQHSAIDRILKNQIFASGLSSGADAINRSLGSLLESLFYNLLDNDFTHNLAGPIDINLGLKRDVFQAENQAWVVVDRFSIGPKYGKELYRYNDIPVNLGAQFSTDVYDIYLRTDPMRVGEAQKLPFWRVAVNNWFGVLPILESVLPPAFNPNEMYDPLRRVEAPFTFPLSEESFEGMDVGTIKSYAISGGINLGVELAGGLHGYKDQITSGESAIDVSLPYTVFRNGEYRINVLKKDLSIAWVGITDLNRTGHKLATRLGKTYYLFSKAIPLWKGLATPVFPFDFEIEEAIQNVFGRVYAFDFREDQAREAYLEAVHGNLAPAQIAWLMAHEDKKTTGVTFFHTKKEQRFETRINTGHNVFLLNRKTSRTHSDAEIEITDKAGKFYILEARQDQNQIKWNMLTGASTKDYSNVADLKVRKVVERTKHENELLQRYEFVADPSPIDIAMSLQIQDKFVETENLVSYLDTLGRFTAIDVFDSIIPFKMRDDKKLMMRRQEVVFNTDLQQPVTMHVTPTHLGSFEASATLRLSTAEFDRIAERTREELWLGFCTAYGIFEDDCQVFMETLWRRNVDRMKGWALAPLRLMDFHFPRADAIDNIETIIRSLKAYHYATTPEDKRDYIRQLFATSHPLEVVEGLLHMANLTEIPRVVKLVTKVKGNGEEESKTSFEKMNGLKIRRGPPMPDPARYDSTVDVESKFNPANLNFYGVKPLIKKISLFQDDTSASAFPTPLPIMQELKLRLQATKLDSEQNHLYVRLEQTGKVQLAKFKLFEQVLDFNHQHILQKNLDGAIEAHFSLSGSESPLQSVIAQEALKLGGSFRLTLAVSPDNQTWSEERHVDFAIVDGLLRAN